MLGCDGTEVLTPSTQLHELVAIPDQGRKAEKLVLSVIRAGPVRWRAIVICKDVQRRTYTLLFQSGGAASLTEARKADPGRFEKVLRVGFAEVSRVRRECPEEAACRVDIPDSSDTIS